MCFHSCTRKKNIHNRLQLFIFHFQDAHNIVCSRHVLPLHKYKDIDKKEALTAKSSNPGCSQLDVQIFLTAVWGFRLILMGSLGRTDFCLEVCV